MRHMRILWLCLVAAVAISVVAVASASAATAPEYLKCAKAAKVGKTYTGKYNNKTCTEVNAKDEGKYELSEAPEGTVITNKSKAATFTAAGKVIKCKKDAGKGTTAGGGVAYQEIVFSDCDVNGNSKEPCETTGAGAGTIKTSELFTRLRYINSSETEIGIVLLGNEGAFATFHCGAQEVELNGYLVGTVANSAKGVTIDFAVNGSGEQAHRAIWVEEEERAGRRLYTGPEEAEMEATLVTVDEESIKGVGVYPY